MNPRAVMANNWHISEHNNTRSLRPEDIAANCNLVNNLMIDVGMIRLSNTEFLGQSGIATHLPPNAGETRIVKATGNMDADMINYVYKHPVLDVYVKVTFRFCRYQSSNYEQLLTVYTIFRDIKDGEISGDNFTHRSMYVTGESFYGGYQYFITGDINVYMYCDDIGFWMASTPSVNNGSNSTVSYNCVANAAPICLLIQKDIESNNIIIMSGQYVVAPSTSTTNSLCGADVRGANGIVGQMPCTWWTKPDNKSIARTGATVKPFTTLPQPNVANKNGAVRVFAAETYWPDETISTWNFGTTNNGAMSDGAIGLIDLLGTGSPREYIAIKGFGPVVDTVAGSPTYYRPTDHLQMLLPWVT